MYKKKINNSNIYTPKNRESSKRDSLLDLVSAVENIDFTHIREMGQALCEEVASSMAEGGFARKFLQIHQLNSNELSRIFVKPGTKYHVYNNSTLSVKPDTSSFLYLPEFYLSHTTFFDNKNSEHLLSSFLKDCHTNCLKDTMLREDLILINLLNNSVKSNTITFSHLDLSTWDKLLESYKEQSVNCLISYSLWEDLIVYCTNLFVPSAKFAQVKQGYLGMLDIGKGVHLYCDIFRDLELRCLQPGEIYITPMPEKLGDITQRQKLTCELFNSKDNQPMGWYFNQIQGMVIKDQIVKGLKKV